MMSEDSFGFSVFLGALFHLKTKLNLTERNIYCFLSLGILWELRRAAKAKWW